MSTGVIAEKQVMVIVGDRRASTDRKSSQSSPLVRRREPRTTSSPSGICDRHNACDGACGVQPGVVRLEHSLIVGSNFRRAALGAVLSILISPTTAPLFGLFFVGRYRSLCKKASRRLGSGAAAPGIVLLGAPRSLDALEYLPFLTITPRFELSECGRRVFYAHLFLF